ncbi:PAAR domain-containing protein [Aquincola sp. S2]|uniref:PAAR domain-containing protein n=1 Tax=Pseudaquabacterium terrae TaxID=2732868 RepID=A0ABX2ELH9_9BURK|nr:PAAR domain-containing protein [Aquabacterium terrae]NRF69448.1 PAAR domain-containing protein [Aquabacterium terrae]
MSRPVIILGDRHSHGGFVIEGAPSTDTHGIPIARMGDKVVCPVPGHGVNFIASGDSTCIVDGKPVARDGDVTACGARIFHSQQPTIDHL